MIAAERALATNRACWNRVAAQFFNWTALPEYGPLAPTEDTLKLLTQTPVGRVLELGCGSGHSLRYLAECGAEELWGIDLSPVQIAYATETLQSLGPRVRLLESPMEVDPGVPAGHFDLVYSIYGLGWTTDLCATMTLAARYLRPGGCFLASGEHPAYSCLQWNGAAYVVAESVLGRRPARVRVVEGRGRTSRDPPSDAGHVRRRDAASRLATRGIDRDALGDRRCDGCARRSGAVVLDVTRADDADDVHHQGQEAVGSPRDEVAPAFTPPAAPSAATLHRLRSRRAPPDRGRRRSRDRRHA